MTTGRHPKKQIQSALEEAATAGFEIVATASGHRWGYVRCPNCKGRDLSVWSTPRVPEDMASQIRRYIARHQH